MPKKSKGSGKKAADEKKPAEESDEAAAPAAPVEDVAEPEEKTEGEAAPEAVGTVGEGEAPAAEAAAAEVEAAAEAPTAVEDAVKGAEGGGENDVEDAGGEGGSEAAPSPSDKGEGAGGAEEEGKGQEEAAAAVEAAPAPEEAPSAGAAGGEEVAAGAERTLRDDSECFIADYTKSGAGQVSAARKFVGYAEARQGRIARSIVEIDPDVVLRVRAEPSLEGAEVMEITAADTVEVVGTCGDWMRLAGDEERWVLSKSGDITLIDLVSQGWGVSASAALSGWGWGRAAAPPPAAAPGTDAAAGAAAEEVPASGGGGWGFGGLAKGLSSRVAAVSANIIAAGSIDPEEAEEAEKNIGDVMTANLDKAFDKDMEIGEGGLSSVRYMTQGISMMEGTLGWLGSAAKEKSKVVQDSINSVNKEELMDRAWTGVKTGVKASSTAAQSASDRISRTTTDFANTQAVSSAESFGKSVLVGAVSSAGNFGKSVLVGVGSSVINAADTVMNAAKGQEERHYPNRALGGVLLIEISGCIAARDPYVDEEDDPFLSDDFDATPLMPGAIAAIKALSEERFGDKVFLMSVARAQVQAKISRWMTKRDFYALTGVARERVHFVREDEEKLDVVGE
ncbi:hypothetical protein T484DRAFT_1780305, partial [Baffinella frigidus]